MRIMHKSSSCFLSSLSRPGCSSRPESYWIFEKVERTIEQEPHAHAFTRGEFLLGFFFPRHVCILISTGRRRRLWRSLSSNLIVVPFLSIQFRRPFVIVMSWCHFLLLLKIAFHIFWRDAFSLKTGEKNTWDLFLNLLFFALKTVCEVISLFWKLETPIPLPRGFQEMKKRDRIPRERERKIN